MVQWPERTKGIRPGLGARCKLGVKRSGWEGAGAWALGLESGFGRVGGISRGRISVGVEAEAAEVVGV